jgi:hypothetical protein
MSIFVFSFDDRSVMGLICLPLGAFCGGAASAAYIIPGPEVAVTRFPDRGLGHFGLVVIVDGIDGRSVAGKRRSVVAVGFAVYRVGVGLAELAAAIIGDDGVAPRPAVTVRSRSTPGERGAAVGALGELGLFGRLALRVCQVAMSVFGLRTAHRKGDRFASGLFAVPWSLSMSYCR